MAETRIAPANTDANTRLEKQMSKFDLNAPISSLTWEDTNNGLFRSEGSALANRETAFIGTFSMERWLDRWGDVTRVHIYATAAMKKAAELSISRGGGVLNLSTHSLRPEEFRIVPPEATIGEAMQIAAGLQ